MGGVNFSNFAPATLEEAVQILANHLDDSDFEYLKKNGTSSLHNNFGRNMRNDWGLWSLGSVNVPNDPTELALDINKRFFLDHGDDLSGMIFYGLQCVIDNVQPDYHKHAEIYYEHWAKAHEFGGHPDKVYGLANISQK